MSTRFNFNVIKKYRFIILLTLIAITLCTLYIIIYDDKRFYIERNSILATNDEIWNEFLDFLKRESKHELLKRSYFRHRVEEFDNPDKHEILQNLVPLFVITPTYPRSLQLPELLRVAQSLKNVKNLKWIVCDDSTKSSPQVIDMLENSGISYQHILSPMPNEFKENPDEYGKFPNGVSNRNAGLEYVLKYVNETEDNSGVIYFADDDNTYDPQLFEEIRKTRKVSAFPVGFVSNRPVSTPLLDKRGRFIEFYDGWIGYRTFAMDMAGFAFSVKHFVEINKEKEVRMPFESGLEENGFLKLLQVKPSDLEFLADRCTKIYVWHTRSEKPSFKWQHVIDNNTLLATNLGPLSEYWNDYIK